MKKYIYILLSIIVIYILLDVFLYIFLFMVDNYEVFIILGLISIGIQTYLFIKQRK